MEERLAQLVYEYSKNNKQIDDKFIKTAFTIIEKSYGFENMILKEERMNKLASYRNNIITIDTNQIINVGSKHKNLYLNIGTGFNSYKYIYLIKILLHEFEHAKQQQIIQFEDSAEGYIVKQELNILNIIYFTRKNHLDYINKMNKIKKNYKKYFMFSPIERLADIKSIQKAGAISCMLQETNTRNLIRITHCEYLLSSYFADELKNRLNSPTKFYLDMQNCQYDWDYIEELASNLSQISRIKFGLDCDEKKLCEINQKRISLSSKLMK